jgi:hypothetical protein
MDKIKSTDAVSAAVRGRNQGHEDSVSAGFFVIRAYRNGELLFEDQGPNLIVNEGLNHKQSVVFLDDTKVGTWFLGLTSGSPTIAAGDTMASHGGWTEITAYAEANRQTWVGVAGSVGVSTNAASPAVFTVNANDTVIGGVFMTSNSTKGGTTGVLMSARAFASNRTLQANDTIEITYQQSDANA